MLNSESVLCERERRGWRGEALGAKGGLSFTRRGVTDDDGDESESAPSSQMWREERLPSFEVVLYVLPRSQCKCAT